MRANLALLPGIALVATLGVTVGGSVADAHVGTHFYTTSFSVPENPISEGGRWVNGGTHGLDWSDVFTASGRSLGTQGPQQYTDSTALLTGSWGPDQTAFGTVHTVNQQDVCFQEVEFRLRSAIDANVNRGYEVGFHMSQSDSAYLIIVRWNGPVGDFDYLFNAGGSQFAVADGDVLKASISGNLITAYINGVPKAQVDVTSIGGTVWTDGNPGIGYNLEDDPPGCAGTHDDYGFTSFTAIDPTHAPPVPSMGWGLGVLAGVLAATGKRLSR